MFPSSLSLRKSKAGRWRPSRLIGRPSPEAPFVRRAQARARRRLAGPSPREVEPNDHRSLVPCTGPHATCVLSCQAPTPPIILAPSWLLARGSWRPAHAYRLSFG
eukprot:scaffold313112_cov27-Tisochrysis_lutea.AAC.2